MVVTRVEIADHIHDAFDADRPVTGDELFMSARRNGARPEVLHTLERLPGTYVRLRDLWSDLPGVPVGG